MTYVETLTALADPTRRALFERLRERPYTVGELAKFARIRQPSASQHLRLLREARLVSDWRQGTRRYYRASPDGLAELRRYLESLWDDILVAYAAADPHPPARQRRTTKPRPRRAR